MDDLVFSLRGIGKTRPGQDGFCLHIARLDIAHGSLLALVGPSGCGKSTALDLLACILAPDAGPTPQPPPPAPSPKADTGRFLFRPAKSPVVDVLAAWRAGNSDLLARLRQRHLGYVLQTGGLLPFLSADDNIFLRCRSLGIADRQRDAVHDAVARLGISHVLRHYPATLSVGERQRVAIAAALAHGPSVILADEPTAALDPCHAAEVLRLFADLARDFACTVVMVTHNREQAEDAGFSPLSFSVVRGPQGAAAVVRDSQEQG